MAASFLSKPKHPGEKLFCLIRVSGSFEELNIVFYIANVIALYIGEERTYIDLLEEFFGVQAAGN